MIIECTTNNLHDFIEQIAQALDTEALIDCSESAVLIPPAYGKGYIKGLAFEHGFSLLVVDVTFKEPLTLRFAPGKVHPLHMLYCAEGALVHYNSQRDVQYPLKSLLGSISTNKGKGPQWIDLARNKRVVFTDLMIDRSEYEKKIDCEIEKMPERMATAFTDTRGDHSFLYQSNYSITIAECIKGITSCEYEGLVRSSFLEAKAYELLSLQIKQYEDDMNFYGRQALLRKHDVDKIVTARDILVKDLQNPPIIRELAHLANINQQKLKTGFKAVFNTTINKYLRNQRLETAKLLLVDGSLSIRDVATRVGYTNQSHFSRRFKEKYGVLPKDFIKTIRTHIDGENPGILGDSSSDDAYGLAAEE